MQKETLYKYELKSHEQNIVRRYRNYKILLYFSLTGLSLMFLSLTFLYYVSNANSEQPDLIITPVFYVNTLIILASSVAIIFAQHHYKKDNYSEYKASLIMWLILGGLFLVGQTVGWIILFKDGYKFAHQSAAYLYAISGIHALHIIGGLVFLVFFIKKSWNTLKDYATSIVYFTDPIAKSQLSLFGVFWHFLGVLWIYLLAFFIIVK